MKISEMIAKLEAVKAEHGDLEAAVHEEGGYYSLTSVVAVSEMVEAQEGECQGLLYEPQQSSEAARRVALIV